MRPLLTIGCSNYDDIEGWFWTASILRQFHVPVSNKEVQLLLVDDMIAPQKELQTMCNLFHAKYVHKPKSKGPAHGKCSVFEEADGLYTLLLDSHVLCCPNSIDYILDGIRNNKIQNDIWSGPLINEHGAIYATEFEMKWRGEMFGIWHTDPDIASGKITEKEICGMGSAYFCVKTDNFVANPFPREFFGFGGEEIIFSEIQRQKYGAKHMCHSALKWQHRFYRPKPVTYRLTVNDKMRNYVVGFYYCGWDVQQPVDYFKKRLPEVQHQQVVKDCQALFPDLLEKNKGGRTFECLD